MPKYEFRPGLYNIETIVPKLAIYAFKKRRGALTLQERQSRLQELAALLKALDLSAPLYRRFRGWIRRRSS